MTHDDRQFLQQLFEAQTQQFQRHLGAVSESFDLKIGLIAEGHESLRSEIQELARQTSDRFDLVDFKIDTLNQKIDGVAADLKKTDARLNQKIDGVAADLKAHRADTEAHHGVYRVKEG
ncbi:MAG: hypothetical protein U9R69_06760 [Thermodesulfobacteriota bacterium]|nr:hypothetical protein [Thermodesulfobacteriota bacterium]